MKEKNNEKEELTELRKIDPDYVNFMMENMEDMKPSPDIRNNLLRLIREKKNKPTEKE